MIDRKGRPLRFLLSGGQCFDGKAAVPLLKPLPPAKKLLADKAYDCAAFRDWLARRGTTPVIPNKINRRKPFPYNKRAYRHRNKIERMFCRLKDARRIATRHAKASNMLCTVSRCFRMQSHSALSSGVKSPVNRSASRVVRFSASSRSQPTIFKF